MALRSRFAALAVLLTAFSVTHGIASAAPDEAIRYTYDEVGQLKGVTDPAGDTATYSWDAVGNLLSIRRLNSLALSIIQVTPGRGAVDDEVTVYGTGFRTTPASNTVKFNGTTAVVSAASKTALEVTVPSGATTGTVSVTTPDGTATSDSQFVVGTPGGPEISDLTPRIAKAGDPISISGSGLGSMATSYVVVSQSRAEVTASTSGSLDIKSPGASGRVRVVTPEGEATGPDLFVPPLSHTVSSVSLTDRMAVGESKPIAMPTSGKIGMVLFDAAVDQRIALGVGSFSSATVSIFGPDGLSLTSGSANSSGGFLDTRTLTQSGTYLILFDPTGSATGSTTLTLHDVPADQEETITPTPAGVTRTLSFATPGQNARLRFSGAAGQAVSVVGSSGSVRSNLSVVNAAGTVVGGGTTLCTTSCFMDARTLPAAGDYALLVDPEGGATGSLTVKVHDATEVVDTLTPTEAGAARAITIGAPGQNARVRFEGTAGDRVALKVAPFTSGRVSIFNPDGSSLRANVTVNSNGAYIDAVGLPATGTYDVVFDPTGTAQGSTTLTLYDVPADQSEAITPTTAGDARTLSFGTPGQNARLTFAGQAGQTISVKGSSVGLDADVSVIRQDGTQVGSKSGFCPPGCASFLDAQQLPTAGNYAVLVDPEDAATGSLTVTVHDASDVVRDVTPTAPGATESITIAAPGQNARLHFEGTAGQRIAARAGAWTGGGNLRLLRPDGTIVGGFQSVPAAGTFLETRTLPVSGTYTLLFDPTGTATGSNQLTVYDVPADQSEAIAPSPSGVARTLTFAAPGQNARLTFTGQAGQTVSVKGSNVGLAAHVSVVRADGTEVGSDAAFCPPSCASFLDAQKLPANGDYAILVDPDQAATGSLTVTVYDASDAVETVVPTASGVATNFTISTPGQNAQLRFEGTAGQRIALNASGWTGGGSVRFYKPDGTALNSANSVGTSGRWVDPVTLPTNGTYTALFDPTGTTTGSETLTLYAVPEDQVEAITPSPAGVTRTISFTAPGERARLTFNGSPGQAISIVGSSVGPRSPVSILRPDGSSLGSETFCSTCTNFLDARTLTTSGSHTVLIDPEAAATGSITVTVHDASDVTDEIEIDGPPVTVTTSVPGQNARLTFDGTAATAVSLSISGVTASANVRIRRPDGSNLASRSVSSSGGVLNTTLPTTGTYSILDDVTGTATGAMTLTLTAQSGPGSAQSLSPTLVPATYRPFDEQRSRQRTVARRTTGPELRTVAERTPVRPKRAKPSVERQPSSDTSSVPSDTSTLAPATTERWMPRRSDRRGTWRADRPETPWQELPPRQAAAGFTALAGKLLRLDGRPLPRVDLSLEGVEGGTRTDRTGRFLIEDVPAGDHVLVVDGGSVSRRGGRYGVFEIKVTLERGTTTALEQPVWMPLLDPAGDHRVASPTEGETVLTTPSIPGLEVQIPAGSRITDRDGQPVRKLNLTAVPVDRTPFPLPPYTRVPTYFTVQPGGAYLSKGARIMYPNYNNLPPGQRVRFWNYDPDDRGWHVYGRGTVTPDGEQVVPDPDVRIWEFSGAMFSMDQPPPSPSTGGCAGKGSGPGGGAGDCKHSDPVDLSTGLFTYSKTDLTVSDLLTAEATRSYRPDDDNSYAFGIGTTSIYDMRLWGEFDYQSVALVLPDGGRVWYDRISPGTGYADAVFEADGAPGPYYKSKIRWVGGGWGLERADGLTFIFGDVAPLSAIEDRQGNRMELFRNAAGNVTRAETPHGRWIKFSYDGSNRVTQAQDIGGRTVSYTYDATGRLETVTDPVGGITSYDYDAAGRMTSIEDPRGITYVENEYDADGRVETQTLADGAEYTFEYEDVNPALPVASTRVTGPGGIVREIEFNDGGYPISDTYAAGSDDEQTWTYDRDEDTYEVTSVTDPLGRETTLEYDELGNPTEVTRLAGTAAAQAVSFSYLPGTRLLTSMTDPLDNTTTYEYDEHERLTTITDPTDRETTLGYDNVPDVGAFAFQEGRPDRITDPAGKTTHLDYTDGDLTSIRDPLGNRTRLYVDPVGRTAAITDPLGARTRVVYDAANQIEKMIAPDGRETLFDYDGNGNLLEVTDAKGNSTSTTYDPMDRPLTRTDGLGRVEHYEYDTRGNLTEHTDRRGKVTTLRYDRLNRRTFAGFGTTGPPGSEQFDSTIEYEYDDGNRLVEADDSAAGTYTRGYDLLDRLISETGPQGAIGYTYDEANRRDTMTVVGQPTVSYNYDDAGRLTGLTRGSLSVALGYDQVGRRASSTLPNGIVQEYTYDDASRLLGIDYERNGSAIGELEYEYDATGRRTAVWGSYARTGIPAALGSAAYDDANQRTSQDGTTLTYDANGNLTADAGATYSWNSRNQLQAVTRPGGNLGFAYDPFGRRKSKTASGTTTSFLQDGANVVQELQSGTPTANLLAGLGMDELFARTTGSGTASHLTDALGSTLALTDGLGWPTTIYTYDPFGTTTTSGAPSDNPYQYTGRENDGNDLYHNRARYYSARTARFASPDPIGLAGGDVNLYAYAGNDPVALKDPTGMYMQVEQNLLATIDGRLISTAPLPDWGLPMTWYTFRLAGRGGYQEVCAWSEASVKLGPSAGVGLEADDDPGVMPTISTGIGAGGGFFGGLRDGDCGARRPFELSPARSDLCVYWCIGFGHGDAPDRGLGVDFNLIDINVSPVDIINEIGGIL